MKSVSSSEKSRRFWRIFGRLGFVIMAAGVSLGLLGVDIHKHNEIVLGRVVEEVKSGRYIATEVGDEYLDASYQIVEYKVNGETRRASYSKAEIGDRILLRYYRRWPGIVWSESGVNWPLAYGVFLSFLGAGFSVARRVWGNA